MTMDYKLLDNGHGRKLEQFGPWRLIRPASQAIWPPVLPDREWQAAHGEFRRGGGENGEWQWSGKSPGEWQVELVGGLRFLVRPTPFGHTGLFMDHYQCWARYSPEFPSVLAAEGAARGRDQFMTQSPIPSFDQCPGPHFLNLFAYSGAVSLALARLGARVTHLDASKPMVQWARENAALNRLEQAPIRWIVEDAVKYVKREARRGRQYDGIILDPPSFGRGPKGQVWKIEKDLPEILDLLVSLLAERGRYFFLSCHTPGFTPLMLKNILARFPLFREGNLRWGEMVIAAQPPGPDLPAGIFIEWDRPDY